MNKENLLIMLHDLYQTEHTKLGMMLIDKNNPNFGIETNWQGGRCNGIMTAIKHIEDFSEENPDKSFYNGG